MKPQIPLSRRALLRAGLAGFASFGVGGPGPVWSAQRRDAYSPLGTVKYPAGFGAFDYVNPRAPKGGRLRLARIGAFDTTNTLTYPGTPAADIRLIYDRLLVASEDEVASYYGLLAETIDVADDFTSIALSLRDGAFWHDGKPIRTEDVLFTFETLKKDGAPFYRQAFAPVRVVRDGKHRIVFRKTAGDRDLLRKIATIPIHPAHFWRDAPDTQGRLPLGSGPYRIVAVDAPRRLVLRREPDYWAADLAVNRGRWNFDELSFEYFRDATVALEAFKVREYDVREETDARRWQNSYRGRVFATSEVQRSETPQHGSGTLHGIVFNLRKAPLNDRRVRLALTLAYDFDTVNRTLFGGAHQRFDSVFGTTDLRARKRAGPEERRILSAGGDVPEPAVLATPDPFAALPDAGTREALAHAARLLDEAGYPVEGGRRIDAKTGEPLVFRLVLTNPAYTRSVAWLERLWQRLGIALSWGQLDAAAASRRLLDRDFELATLSWSPARLPGTAERLLWHSALADTPHSYALSGIKERALDAAIEALERARDPSALQAAGRAFDRKFRHALVLLPLWREDRVRLAWWNAFQRPEAERAGFPPSPVDRWWAT